MVGRPLNIGPRNSVPGMKAYTSAIESKEWMSSFCCLTNVALNPVSGLG